MKYGAPGSYCDDSHAFEYLQQLNQRIFSHRLRVYRSAASIFHVHLSRGSLLYLDSAQQFQFLVLRFLQMAFFSKEASLLFVFFHVLSGSMLQHNRPRFV